MTDKEKMISIIGKVVVKTTASYIADRLIIAGFGSINKCPCGCSHVGDDVCMAPDCELMKEYR